MHHYYPRDIFAFSFLDNIILSGSITSIIFFILFAINKSLFVKYPYLLATFFIFDVIGPLIHRFCHYRDCENNFIIKLLQNIGIICSHEHHKTHHDTSNKHYCVITPYSNYLLDGIHFWSFLEYIIYTITSIKPHKKLTYKNYQSIHTHLHKNTMECPTIATREDIHNLKIILNKYKKCN
jgi:ubiquitin-conjugating enzyme E2 variant